MAVRRERVAALIRDVVSEMFLRRIKDPRIGFVSVVNVEVTRDLSLAKVFISVLGDDEDRERTMEGLKSAQGLIRSEVARELGVRYAPEIHFFLDQGIEHSIKVSQLLEEIKKADADREEK